MPAQVKVGVVTLVGPTGPPVSVGALGTLGSTVTVRCRESFCDWAVSLP